MALAESTAEQAANKATLAFCRFVELSNELKRKAQSEEDPGLLGEIKKFLVAYESTKQNLPRKARELLEAQMLCRRFLTTTRNYGLVYDFYKYFKNPYGVDIDWNLENDYVPNVRSASRAYPWIRGYESVLECGCGPAALGLALAKYNGRWIASDVCRPEGLDRLIEIFSPGQNFEFHTIDAVTLGNVPDETIGAVVSKSLFEHLLIDDALAHIHHAYRVLKHGGDLIIECPAGVGPPSDITRQFAEYDSPKGLHIKEYKIGEIVDILRDAGFTSVRSILLRSRFLSYLPIFVQRCNAVSPKFVTAVSESLAERTWRRMRATALSRSIWKQFWGHLGAISIRIVARKP